MLQLYRDLKHHYNMLQANKQAMYSNNWRLKMVSMLSLTLGSRRSKIKMENHNLLSLIILKSQLMSLLFLQEFSQLQTMLKNQQINRTLASKQMLISKHKRKMFMQLVILQVTHIGILAKTIELSIIMKQFTKDLLRL